VLGVPTSAGAFAPGQEEAPQALRDAGLLGLLRDAGIAVSDHGDRPVWRWRPDRGRPRAQNLHTVVSIVRETAARVADAAATGEVTLVLGGDCTVGIGTVAGHVAAAPDERVGLIYLDSHADLNIPESVHEGALDWMGMAHMLAIGGAEPELVRVGGRVPLLEADRVVLVGWGPEQATEFERAAIAERGLGVVAVDCVAADPEAAALKARRRLRRCDRILVHFDVDLIDFTETPLSENWGRNEGVAFDTALRAFSVLVADPALAAVTITELNPNHTEEGAGTVERFARAIATSLGASWLRPGRASRTRSSEEGPGTGTLSLRTRETKEL
jgi:arginase